MIARQLMRIFPVLFGLMLVFVIACGSPAATPAAAPIVEPTAVTVVGETPQATPVPVVQATPVPEAPEAGRRPAGTLNVGLKETGVFNGHPEMAVNPGLFVSQTPPLGEGLLFPDINMEIQKWLLESWSISPDFTTWTFKIREGVQFHKGYGEMTAEDVAWSYVEGWAANDKHVRASEFRAFWQAPGGSVDTPDRYTVVVNTGEPLSEAVVLQNWMTAAPGGSSNWVASKRQSEELGIEAANKNPALTGSWEFVEERPAQLWRMQAVENHWLQTPYFAELVFWEIPEESARLAGFQTGQLDTFSMAFDSIPLVEGISGARLMSIPGAIDYGLQFYGNYLVEAAAGDPPAAYNPDLPWVSSNFDLESAEWVRARKVRQALSIAIDRETIMDTVLRGFAKPGVVWFWGNHEHQLGDRRWDYDPERARQLLAEAGYSDGFRITLTPALRGAPAEVEACEAVAAMWTNIGVDVSFQRIPYETLRPQVVGRTYQGATCHAAGARVVTVGAIPQLTTIGSFNDGATHPFLEDIMPQIAGAVDPAELERLESEMGAFVFDQALTRLGLYLVDAVWPVGPRLEPWTEHVRTADVRDMNGYEYIRPRQ